MRIKSLWVSEYKNLKEIDLKFNSNLITLLVGQNGLGKSNLIEILTIIFRDLDLLENEDDYTSWSYYTDKGQFEFVIDFECSTYDVIIAIKKDLFEVKIKPLETIQDYEVLSFIDFKNHRKLFLPKFVIGYYSGENKRIKELIQKHVVKQNPSRV
jgi:energy-coupling factor transporter ATP-binding protein EcfA2